ncbi:DUF5655 domain-containing protein [Pediococcus siamensis]|uniref:DUF5655 domain-containing protein n=1 Tax=Pediococcus siamensis TaxID=381829 RepID=UPI0039A36BAC
MELYKINDQSLKKISGSTFDIERSLQNIVENNLEVVFGIDFVASEFSVSNYRLDTVGYDKDLNAFVIIEYKRDSKDSVIDQGFAYLNTLLSSKADFVLKYNEVFSARKKTEEFDWSQSKVIFVAGSFTPYQIDAANNPSLPIELYEARKYKNNYMTLNQIKKTGKAFKLLQNKRNIKKKPQKKPNEVENVLDIEVPTEERLLESSNETVQDLYQRMKATLLEWDPSFEIKPTKYYIGFRLNHHNVIDFLPQNRALKVWLNLTKDTLNDPENLTRDVSQTGHWGNGDYELKLTNDEQLEYILSLMKQAWRTHSNSGDD